MSAVTGGAAITVRLTVNGERVERAVSPRRSLADFLREDLGLTGTHVGCEHGVCGACTVLVGGRTARSCLLFAVQLEGATVTTIEGLTPAEGLGALQAAFRDCHALQCGFCTPAMIVTAHELLAENPAPARDEIRDAIAGNLCMCTGYVNIVNAIEHAARNGGLGGEPAPPHVRTSSPAPPHVRTSLPAPPPVQTSLPASPHGRWIGQPLPRTEDARLTTGRGRYLDDLSRPGLLHCAMLRSPHAHARIVAVDASAAARMPGVHAVLTGAEAATLSQPIRPLIPTPVPLHDWCLAVDRARFAGEPVAAVAAVDRATAEDALERIRVEYEPLPAVVDPEEALRPGAPLLYPELGTNVLWHDVLTYGDVDGAFARADGMLRERFELQRYASTPLETFGVIAEHDAGTDQFTFWTNDQRPGLTLAVLAGSLGVPQSRLRLVCPDIGGGFGNKRRPAYLLVCALLARRARRPVKYLEDRIESLTALMHTCNGVMDVDLAYRNDGTVLALAVRDVADEGKNLVSPTQHNLIKLGNIANGYRIGAVRYEPYSVLTNKCPSGANRGIGKPFMCFAVERSMALLARRLGLDPAELRLRNYVTADAMPYTTPTGAQYDSGDYPATLRRALDRAGYARLREEQARGRREGRLLGIGIATSVEPAGTNLASYELVTGRRAASGSAEAAMVRVEPDGHVRASIGDPASGQGYETVIAQIVADELGVTPAEVHVERGFDSATTPWLYLSGNYSNKFSVTDVGAVVGAARTVRDKLLRIAAHRLEIAAADLELAGGEARVRGVPGRGLPLREMARTAYADVLGLPPGEEPGLEARHVHQNPLAAPVDAERRVRSQLVFANAAHCCVVEIDPRTGAVKVLRHVVVHDCGRELNPSIVEGMVHGSTVHGMGAALLEEFRYDAAGQLLTATFMDYLKPTALDVPDLEVDHLESPSPFTTLGSKGVGEGGAIPGPAAVANAVEDALAPFGVVVRALPITPERVWRWMNGPRDAV